MKPVEINIAEDIKPDKKQVVFDKVKLHSTFDFSFISLLVSSTVICTLGLLLNSTATIIGGMIISPLMWPLMRLALGLSYGRKTDIKSMVPSLFLSILVVIFTAFLIGFISPIKTINSEIIARSNPNLLDLVVALIAGGIATLAVIKSRVSESLAGVAIASSLLPPLCVTGIGLALASSEIIINSFLFFSTNALSSIFMAVLTFSLIGFKSKKAEKLRRETMLVTAIALIISAIPLYSILKNQSFETLAYYKIELNLEKELSKFSHDIKIRNIETNFDNDKNNVLTVNVDLLIPENININYQQQQELVRTLENDLEHDINLNLTLQRSISVLSETNINDKTVRKTLSENFVRLLGEELPEYTVTSYEASKTDKGWTVTTLLAGNPETIISDGHLSRIETNLMEIIDDEVVLNTKIIPIISIKDQKNAFIKGIEDTVIAELSIFDDLEISEVEMIKNPDASEINYLLKIVVLYPSKKDIRKLKINELIEIIELQNEIEIETNLEVINKDTYSL